MFVGQSVYVFNGSMPAVIHSIRALDGILTIIPTQWMLANDCKPVFYMNPKDVTFKYNVGDRVSCAYGKGQIQSIREDGVYVVTLVNWILANGKSPVLYLQESAIAKYVLTEEGSNDSNNDANKAEKTSSYVADCLKKAAQFKTEATDFYKAAKYEEARGKYLEALGSMHYLNADLTNLEKASVFELSVPCHNNIALCCLNMEKYSECVGFAKNCLLLVSSLEDKISTGSSEVWKCLTNEKGVTLDKLIDWKRKALFYMGKAELKNKDFESCVTHLEQALSLCVGGPDAPRIKEMLETARKHRAAELKREKSTWSKAFKVSKAEQEAEEVVAATSSPAASPVKRTAGSSTSATGKATSSLFGLDAKTILGDKAGQKGSKADAKPASSTAVGFKSDSLLNWFVGGTSLMLLAVGFIGFGNLRDTFSRIWRKH